MKALPAPAVTASRMAFLTSALIIILVLVGLVTLQESTEAGLSDDLERLTRLRSVASFEPNLADLEQSRTSERYSEFVMEGGTAAELSARLQARINELASRGGIQVLRSSDVPPKDRDTLKLVGADIEMTGPADAIYTMLGDIELATPLLVIDRLVLRSAMANQPEDRGDAPMSVTMRVYAASRGSTMANQIQ